MYQNGGPIIGIQIENEYGHCGGLNGEAGEIHMRRLTELAKKVGLTVPLYTATGWGGAATGGLLPVMGGYCEAPWDQRTTELEPNENYVFTNERNDPNIGSDYGKKNDLTYDIAAFPYLTAELGGGLQVTHHRRPVARAKDIGAMSLAKLGSGVNLLGYYMYHGGTNPEGKRTTLQESRATGYLNDLPVFSYDFSAPVREYGQMSDTLNEIKLLAMFINDFGEELCGMQTVLSEEQRPEDFETLRTAVRRKGNQGYLFVNNYQRRRVMKEHMGERLEVTLNGGTVTYPPEDILDGDFFFVPFYMPVGNGVLRSALAAPLCRLRGWEKDVYVFYSDTNPHYEWEKGPMDAEVLTISRQMALNSWKVGKNREYLVFTEDKVIESDTGYEILIRKGSDLKSYPALPETPEGYQYAEMEGSLAVYKRTESMSEGKVQCRLVCKTHEKKYYEVELEYPENINDCFVKIDFEGDQAKLLIDDKFVGDWFYTGETWEIGMKRFGFPEKIKIEVTALRETDPVFLETRPTFYNGIACEIKEVNMEPERVVTVL